MTDSNQAATEPPVPVGPWPAEELTKLLHEFGDQLEIGPELHGGRVILIAREKVKPLVALGADPVAMRANLIAKGYVPWT